MYDVAIAGLGPAGRALAHRCAVHGLRVLAIDPHPDRAWAPTYGAWTDELPSWLPDVAAARVAEPAAFTVRLHRLAREYQVFDNAALRPALNLTGVTVRAAHLDGLGPLADQARIVIDARGAIGGAAEHTAYGLVLPRSVAAPALDGAAAWFMDWRADNGTAPGDPPSFLYAVPTGPDTMLLEETCLVGRPALDLSILADRLTTRLAARGVAGSDGRVERVRFPVDAPRRRGAFGARGGFVHPGTGYSVAAALAAADPVAAALAQSRATDRTLVDRALWSYRARAVHRLRRLGLRSLLELAPEQVVPFFAAFLDLPIARQRAYLSGRHDLVGVLTAMVTLARSLPPDLLRVLARSASLGQD